MLIKALLYALIYVVADKGANYIASISAPIVAFLKDMRVNQIFFLFFCFLLEKPT